MAFFDDFENKVTDVFSKVAAKTKDIKDSTISQTKTMGDISRLKSQQKIVENNITGYYCQLGKAYYENSGDKCEYIYSELVDAIANEKERLSSINKELDGLTGIKRCTSCNSVVPNDSVFCNICGSRLTEERSVPSESVVELEDIKESEHIADNMKESKPVCTNCGAEIVEGAKFCTNCGAMNE